MDDASRLLSTFLDLVKIDSPSFEERNVADYLTRRLESLGVQVTPDSSASVTGSNTGNLICSLGGAAEAPRILLAAHMDTVEPGRGIQAKIEGDIITSEGETVLGADDKAGVAVLVELVERIAGDDLPHGPIDLLFTVAEEKGLLGARNLDLSLLERPDFAYVLDAEGLPGEVVIAAPYYESLKAVFIGKAAHSGVEPEAGANALTAAANGISKVEVGRIDKETTVNIGTIHGGRDRNIVPDRVEIGGEVRSLDETKLASQVERLTSVLRSVEGDGIRLEVETRREFDGFAFPRDHPAAVLARDGIMAAGLMPHLRVAGGGSDANILSAAGVPSLVLSVGYHGAHAVEERVHLSDMASSVEYLLQMVRIAASRENRSGR